MSDNTDSSELTEYFPGRRSISKLTPKDFAVYSLFPEVSDEGQRRNLVRHIMHRILNCAVPGAQDGKNYVAPLQVHLEPETRHESPLEFYLVATLGQTEQHDSISAKQFKRAFDATYEASARAIICEAPGYQAPLTKRILRPGGDDDFRVACAKAIEVSYYVPGDYKNAARAMDLIGLFGSPAEKNMAPVVHGLILKFEEQRTMMRRMG